MMMSAFGGPVTTGGIAPLHVARGGLINSAVPGRTDRIKMSVRPNSYIVPADVVSGIGQGNTLAGAKLFDQILVSGPYGTKLGKSPHAAHTPGMPRLGIKSAPMRFADGGDTGGGEGVPIITAGGEYVIDPEIVAQLGGGDPAKGHAILDRMVTSLRKQVIGHMRALPGPRKD